MSVEALKKVAETFPALRVYVPALDVAERPGLGRIHAMQWQVVFQHMLIMRRTMCQDAGLNFFDTEQKAVKAVKRLKVDDPYVGWLLVFAATVKSCTGDDAAWKALVAIM